MSTRLCPWLFSKSMSNSPPTDALTNPSPSSRPRNSASSVTIAFECIVPTVQRIALLDHSETSPHIPEEVVAHIDEIPGEDDAHVGYRLRRSPDGDGNTRGPSKLDADRVWHCIHADIDVWRNRELGRCLVVGRFGVVARADSNGYREPARCVHFHDNACARNLVWLEGAETASYGPLDDDTAAAVRCRLQRSDSRRQVRHEFDALGRG